jgi:NitT/TauT family transport system substrate-binding protein
MLSKLSVFVAALLLLSPVSAQSQEKTKLTIGSSLVAEAPQYVVALDKGLFAKNGIDVKTVSFTSGREGFEALIGGQLDVVLMAEFPAVVGVMRHQKFSVVSILSRYNGSRIIAKGSGELASIKDLAGKRIGVTVGTNTHYMLDRELAKAGISAEIVNVGPSDLVPALVRGDIDAAAPFPNYYGGAKRTLGDQYQELRIPSYGTNFVLAAKQEVIDDNPKAIQQVLAAMLEAEKIVNDDPSEAQQIVAKMVGGVQSIEAIRAGWPEYEYRLTLDDKFVDLLLDEGKWIAGLGLIKGVEPSEELFRSAVAKGPLASVAPDRVTLH